MSVILVTRHPGAIEWARRQQLGTVRHCRHLDPEQITAGDLVVGTLPIQLAAAVCARGAHYWHLTLDLPESARGRELDADELTRFGARIERYWVQRCPPTSAAQALKLWGQV